MDMCLEHTFTGAGGPCVGFDSPLGVLVNVAIWAGLALFVVLEVRVISAVRRESPQTDEDVRGLLLRGRNAWLFVGGYVLWFGAYFLGRFVAA